MTSPEGEKEVWVAREYGMLTFVRLVIALSLLWATVGAFLYNALIDYLGWGSMGIELRWTLFVALSMISVCIAAAIFLGVFLLFRSIYTAYQRSKLKV